MNETIKEILERADAIGAVTAKVGTQAFEYMAWATWAKGTTVVAATSVVLLATAFLFWAGARIEDDEARVPYAVTACICAVLTFVLGIGSVAVGLPQMLAPEGMLLLKLLGEEG